MARCITVEGAEQAAMIMLKPLAGHHAWPLNPAGLAGLAA
jgi:hypothetical protein